MSGPGATKGLWCAGLSWTQALREAATRLTAAGIPSARLEARLLLGHALGVGPEALLAHGERPLTGEAAAAFADLLVRRLERRPLAHLVGRRDFWTLSFRVSPATLVPRPDTETLIEALLALRPDHAAPLRILDLGTGTGCLLLAALSEYPHARGLGVDASAEALEVARANAEDLGLSERAAFALGDWGTGLEGPFDVILSNPPYIPEADIAALEPEVARFEPWGALSGGADGLDAYRVLAADLPRLLAPDGLALVELGVGQDATVRALFAAAGLYVGPSRADLAGISRCIIASRAQILAGG